MATTEEFQVRFSEDGGKEIVRTFNDMLDSAENAEEAADKLASATNNLRRAADPAQRAFDRLTGSINTLTRAEEAGIISATERLQLQNRLTISAQSQLQPIGTLVSQIGAETAAWRLNAVERNATLATMRQVNSMTRQGIQVSEQERAAILAANLALETQKKSLTDNETARKNSIAQAARDQKEYLAAVRENEQEIAEANKREADERAATVRRIKTQNESLSASYDAIYRRAGTSVETATERQRAAFEIIDAARSAGIRTATQAADAEQRVTRQYAEQIDPLLRTGRLQAQRIAYMTGLAREGRNLGIVNADLAKLEAEGIVLDKARVNSLRQLAVQADKIQNTFSALGRAKTLFNSVFGGIGLGLAAAGFTRALDEVTTIGNRLALVSNGAGNANTLFAANVKLAKETRSDLSATVEGFSRIARSTAQIGLSQQAALDLTKSVNQALKISGASAQEAAATVVQFGQALSANRLGGDELRSVLEQAPRLSQAIVDGINLMNRTDPTQLPKKLEAAIKKSGDVNIGTLRDLAKAGLLTTEVVSKAVLSQQQAISDEFARTTPTIKDSFTVLNTAWLDFLNNFNKGTGAAGAISNAIVFVADNLDKIATAGILVGSVLAGAFVGSTISKFIGFLQGIPAAFSAQTLAVAESTVQINSENAALARNTALQLANAESRAVGASATGGQTAARATGAIAGAGQAAVTTVASGVTATNLTRATAGATALDGKLASVAGNATRAAGGTGVLAGAMSLASKAGAGISAAFGALSVTLGVVAALAAAWLLFKDQVKLADDQLLIYAEGTTQKAIKGSITLGDVAGGIMDVLTGKTDDLTKSQRLGAEQAAAAGVTGAKEVSEAEQKSIQERLDATAVLQTQTMSVYDNMKEGIVKSTIDVATSVLLGARAVTDGLQSIAVSFAGTIERGLQRVANGAITLYNNTIVPILNAAKTIGIGNGAEKFELLKETDVEGNLKLLERIQTEGQKALVRNARESLARNIVSGSANRQRASGLAGAGENNVTNVNKPAKVQKDPDIAAYRSLRNELDPLAKATYDYSQNVELLNRAFSKGLITDENGNVSLALKNDLLGRLKQRYDEAVNPLNKYASDTAKETAIMSLSADKRELATAIMSKENETRDKLKRPLEDSEKRIIAETEALKLNTARRTALNDSIAEAARNRAIEIGQFGLTAQEIEAENRARSVLGDALKNNVAGAQADFEAQKNLELQFIQTRDAAKQVSDIYEAINAPQLAFARNSNALNTILSSGRISLQRYNFEMRALATTVLNDSTNAFAGFERALITIKNQTEDTAAGIETVFTNAFSNTRDQFAAIFTDGTFDLQGILKGITGDLAKTLFNKVADPFISGIGQAFNIPGFGSGGLTDKQIQANNVYVNGNVVGGNAGGFGGFGLPTTGGTGFAPNGTGDAGNVVTSAVGALSDPAKLLEQSTQAAGQLTTLWSTTGNSISGSVGDAFSQMILSSNSFKIADAATNAAVTATTTATTAATTGVHIAAETAKTGATVAGVATRTGAEVTGAVASKGITISTMLTSVAANAVKAATGAYAAIAGIPFVGPVLAPVAAAAALAGVFALGRSVFSAQDGFGNVPYDGALTELHKEEMVLPAKYANPLRDQLTGGNGAGNNDGSEQKAPEVNVDTKIVNVMDPKGMVEAMQSNQGQKVILNVIQSNPDIIRRALS